MSSEKPHQQRRRPELPWHLPLDEEPGLRELLPLVLEANRGHDTWERLWDRLIHQYDIDHVGIKIFPLLVRAAFQLPPAQRYEHLILIGSIAFCAQLPGSQWVLKSAPESIQSEFQQELSSAARLIAESLMEEWDAVQTKNLILSYAATRKFPRLAAYLDQDDDETQCPDCGHLFTIPLLLLDE